MLNLHNPIAYTDEEIKQIKVLLSTNKLSGNDIWKKSTKDLKHHISEHTLREQGCRCAYCETLLQKGDSEIEHLAPKSRYRNFTFEPKNLTTACGRCNSISIKGAKDTILQPPHGQYEKNRFKIVHPYLSNNPDTELPFTDNTRTTFDKKRCTQLGLETIAFFEWDNDDARFARLREACLRNVPLPIAQLIIEISTYK